MHDPADDPAIIDAMRTTPAARHQGFNPLPLRIAQPIELLPHQGLLDSEVLNHNSSGAGTLIEYRPRAIPIWVGTRSALGRGLTRASTSFFAPSSARQGVDPRDKPGGGELLEVYQSHVITL